MECEPILILSPNPSMSFPQTRGEDPGLCSTNRLSGQEKLNQRTPNSPNLDKSQYVGMQTTNPIFFFFLRELWGQIFPKEHFVQEAMRCNVFERHRETEWRILNFLFKSYKNQVQARFSFKMLNKKNCQLWQYKPWIPTLKRKCQADISEFKAKLDNIMSSRPSQPELYIALQIKRKK